MLPKKLDEVKISDFEILVSNTVEESNILEFKSELKVGSINDKKEFLADVSAFANANGGDLIYGISEEDGGLRLTGIDLNPDHTILQIESIIRDGVKPRIRGVRSQAFQMASGKYILLVRIPNSSESPHMVIFHGSNKFYSRGSKGKYLIDVHELGILYREKEKAHESIVAFVNERIAEFSKGNFLETLLPFAKIVVHLIPHDFSNSDYDLFKREYDIDSLPPLGGGSRTPSRNIHGFICASRSVYPECHAYVQVFRNGVIESVESDYLRPYNNQNMFGVYSGFNYEAMIVKGISEFLRFYQRAEINPPFSLFLNYLGVKGYGLSSDRVRPPFLGAKFITTESVSSGELIISSFDEDIPQLLKKHFDSLWNAWGYTRSYNYSEAGVWKPEY